VFILVFILKEFKQLTMYKLFFCLINFYCIYTGSLVSISGGIENYLPKLSFVWDCFKELLGTDVLNIFNCHSFDMTIQSIVNNDNASLQLYRILLMFVSNCFKQLFLSIFLTYAIILSSSIKHH